ERIAFAGVGKREDEIEYALQSNIRMFNVESIQELQSISRIALRLGVTARIALRINPNIDAESHPYISTGLTEHKFGIESGKALEAFQFAATLPSVEVAGLHVHIGSQITRVEPYRLAAEFVLGMVRSLRDLGIVLQHLDLGGGFGVRYVNVLQHESLPKESDENVPAPREYVDAMLPSLRESGCSVWLEPGRALVADSGILLTRVLYLKENGKKKFVIVDAGMNDLLRPSLYNAYHQIVPVSIETYDRQIADVVGPVCETGDFLARDRQLPNVRPGDLLAVMTTGAYGFVNASNYNGRLKPAEVLVTDDKVRVVRPRQTPEQLLT
ncbi:MAG: diaminopimelate decarboxylase, partial [Bacteroidota bacterium]